MNWTHLLTDFFFFAIWYPEYCRLLQKEFTPNINWLILEKHNLCLHISYYIPLKITLRREYEQIVNTILWKEVAHGKKLVTNDYQTSRKCYSETQNLNFDSWEITLKINDGTLLTKRRVRHRWVYFTAVFFWVFCLLKAGIASRKT